MNQGAELLTASGASLDEIASAADVTRTTAARWRTGEKSPSGSAREKLKRKFKIPIDAWDRPPAGAAKKRAPARLRAPAVDTQSGKRGEAERRLRDQLARLEAMRAEEDLAPGSLLELERIEVRATSELARLTGENGEITEARILRTPQWRRVLDCLKSALRPWPAAMRAAGEALRRLDEEGAPE